MRCFNLGFFIISCFMCSACFGVLDSGATGVTQCSESCNISLNYLYAKNCAMPSGIKAPDGTCYATCQTCRTNYHLTNTEYKVLTDEDSGDSCYYSFRTCVTNECSRNTDCETDWEQMSGGIRYTRETNGSCSTITVSGESVGQCSSVTQFGCAPGYYVNDEEECVECSSGYYKDEIGPGPCKQCPQGSDTESNTTVSSPDGATSINECYLEQGYVDDSGASKPHTYNGIDDMGVFTYELSDDCHYTD